MDNPLILVILAVLAACAVRACWRQLLELLVIISLTTVFAGVFAMVWLISSWRDRG